jgi:hypothetical protein
MLGCGKLTLVRFCGRAGERPCRAGNSRVSRRGLGRYDTAVKTATFRGADLEGCCSRSIGALGIF